MYLTGMEYLFKGITSEKLMITGIHKYVRHPLYMGAFIFIWGLFIVLPYFSFLIANIFITAYTLIGIYFEESKLEMTFGDIYKEYKKQVPMIIPFTKQK